jgi:hypothetical protein
MSGSKATQEEVINSLGGQSHGLRNEMHLLSTTALNRSSLHAWFLRLQRKYYNSTSKQAM